MVRSGGCFCIKRQSAVSWLATRFFYRGTSHRPPAVPAFAQPQKRHDVQRWHVRARVIAVVVRPLCGAILGRET